MTEVFAGAESPPVTSEVHEGIWVMGHGLVTVDVGYQGAWLMAELSHCQYGGVTPECDADLAEAAVLIREMGYRRTGEYKEEDGAVHIELI